MIAFEKPSPIYSWPLGAGSNNSSISKSSDNCTWTRACLNRDHANLSTLRLALALKPNGSARSSWAGRWKKSYCSLNSCEQASFRMIESINKHQIYSISTSSSPITSSFRLHRFGFEEDFTIFPLGTQVIKKDDNFSMSFSRATRHISSYWPLLSN